MDNRINIEKLRKLVRFVRIMVLIFYRISFAAAALLVVIGVVMLFVPDSKFIMHPDSQASMGLTLDGFIRYRLNPQISESVNTKPVYSTIVFMAAVTSALLALLLKQLVQILNTVEQDRPFAAENAKRLSVMGIVLIIGSFIVRAAEFAVAYVMIETYNIPNIDLNYSMDTTMIITGLLLIILSGVFRYGTYLQQEYDATV